MKQRFRRRESTWLPSSSRPSTSPSPIGSILAARDLGLSVPRDVSVIGIDDHELAGFFGLSTIAQFPHGLGEKAVEVLMDQLHPGKRDQSSLNMPMPFELIVRSSTVRPSQ